MIIDNNIFYDGSLLKERFAYKFKRDNVNPLGDVIIFRGPMEVTTNLIDLEDSLNNDFIYSDDALHAFWEIPNCSPFAAVCFQRLYVQLIADRLRDYIAHSGSKTPVIVVGDDIMIHARDKIAGKKVSVSITKSTNNVALGHLGLNICAGDKAPKFAGNLGLHENELKDFAVSMEDIFYETLQDIFVATTKVC